MTQIDPLILKKLDAFSQRRRRLIILRGICAAIATLLLAMMIVALIDAIFILPDAARWGLSLTAYAVVIFVEWRASLRLLMHAPEKRRLARLVEHAEPRLREDLLSAVELGETAGERWDSEQFRSLLQSDVAHRMEGMDMERLLPVNLVRRYIGMGIAAALLCLAAFVLSGLQFGTLMLRALVPGANLARVSQVKVRIVEPASPDKVVAQGETEPLVIEISGRLVNAARLETITAGGREVLKMTPMPGDRFSATIQVGRDDVTYRVFAGDAVTRKFRLHAAPRPHVARFEKTFRFPGYVKRAPQTVTDENGDLAALEGSEVDLRIDTSQKIREGELRVEQGKKSFTVPLTPAGASFTAHLSLAASGTYRVHLVGAETGFENKFSPEYELRAEPDLVPQVDLETPRQDLILPANEIVTLRGVASDDQGLAKVSQFVRINEGGWRELPLAKEPGRTAAIDHRWDLYEQGVKPGDLLITKLVAQDLKGSRAESRSVRVTVTKSGFETKRLEALEAQRALATTLQALRAAGEQLAKRGREARDQFERLPDGDEQRRQVVITADSAYAEFQQAMTAAWTQLEATLKGAEAGHAGADLVQIGRTLIRGDAGTAQPGKAVLEALSADPLKPPARELMREFAEACEKTGQRMRKAEESHRTFLMAEEFGVIAENLLVIAAESRRLAELSAMAKDTVQWTQVANRLRVVLAESRSIEEVADIGTPRGGDRLKWIRRQLGDTRGAAEGASAAAEPGPALRDVVQNLTRTADAVSRNALDNFRDLAARGANEYSELLRSTEAVSVNFDRLRDELSRIASRKAWPEALRTSVGDRRWETRGLVFKLNGDLEETRAAADTFFVNDLRITTLALDALRMTFANAAPEERKAKLADLEKSFRLLEAGHGVAEVLDGVQFLGAAERWEIATAHERIAGPRDWRWLEQRLRCSVEEVARLQSDENVRAVAQEALKILQGATQLPAWGEVNREMNERFNPQREPSSSSKDVEPVAAQVKQALDLLRKPMEEARKRIAGMAPKLHEMMKELAQKTEELKQKTEEQAQQAAEKKPGEVQSQAQQALAQQQRLNERVETLKDALRADANQQDILKNGGRERARDADDALALLKEPPPKAEAALNEATQVADAAAKAGAMKAAAQEQQKLASALDQLAKHYENADNGKAEESRMALRATEEQTGIREAMDQQFAKAQELAKMAEDSPEELLKKLEQALPKNPMMQQELSAISRNTLDEAAMKLAAASTQENQVARDVQKLADEQKAQAAASQPQQQSPPNQPQTATNAPGQNAQSPTVTQNKPPPQNQPAPVQPQPADAAKPNAAPPPNPMLAQAAQQQQPIAQNANEAGDDISRAGRHEQRLNNTPPGEMLEQLGNRVKETAKTQVPKAEQSLAQAQQAAQAAPDVNGANEQLQKHLGELRNAANAPKAEPAMKPRQSPMENPFGQIPIPGAPNSPNAPAAAQKSPAGEEAPAQASPAGGTPPAPAAPQQQANAAAPGAPPAPNPPDAPSANAMPAAPATSPAFPADAPDLLPMMPQLPAAFAQNPAATATPMEQLWMARTLDSLDAALHGEPPAEASQEGQRQAQQGAQSPQGQQDQQGKPQAGQQPGQQQAKQMSQAQQAMNNAAKAAAAAMRASRAEKPAQNQGEPDDNGPEQAVSRDGAKAQAAGRAHGRLQDAKGRSGEWGKLPKQVAEQLTRGQNENVAGEYRNQVETYYKVIAEKAKKP